MGFSPLSAGAASTSSDSRFVDHVELNLMGGRGGSGCLSHHVTGPSKKRPDGGHGGHGGEIVFRAVESMKSFNFHTRHYKGHSGTHGSSNSRSGRGPSCIGYRRMELSEALAI